MKKICIYSLMAIITVGAFANGSSESQSYNLRLGVATPTDHPHSISARKFAETVSEKTDGKVTVTVFDNGSLGSNPELLDGVKTGVIDLTISTPGIMAEYSDITGILELPYLFTSKEHMMKVTRGDIGNDIANLYLKDTGIRIIGYFGGAQRNMITTSKAIKTIADLRKMKMRTWEWEVMLNWWKSIGAIGTVISFPEVYTALQTGVVDGAENEFTTFTTARWAEVAKYIALTQHNITVRPMVINEKKLTSMSQDLQDIILSVALETADFDVNLEGELDQKNMKKLQAEYNVMYTNPDKTPFIKASSKIIENFANEKKLKSLAEKIKQASE